MNTRSSPLTTTEPTTKIRVKNTDSGNKLFSNTAIQARHLADQSKTLSELKTNLESFEGCLLKKTATNTVFADGNQEAKIMLIGEAPGANEDLEGRPFCGDSGKLLDTIFLSIDICRSKNLYITNSIFWRPPGNRKPTDQELDCCLPFVEKHISLINPKLLILAGSTACTALLTNTEPISKQRGRIFSYHNQYLKNNIDTVVIFHPSYLLRQPSQKKLAWHDMLFIKNLLGK
ncbi:MAG: uracil-DNA glycosylase [Rickettsiales bacterium]|nr:uracil-DNA glycosylase [Rickettsiales bacterium]